MSLATVAASAGLAVDEQLGLAAAVARPAALPVSRLTQV